MFNDSFKIKDPSVAKQPTPEAPIPEELTPEPSSEHWSGYHKEDCALEKHLVEEIFQEFDGQDIGPRMERLMDLLQRASADVHFSFDLHLVLRELGTFANIGTGHISCDQEQLFCRSAELVAALTVQASLDDSTSAVITALEQLVMCSDYFCLEDTSMNFKCPCNMRRRALSQS